MNKMYQLEIDNFIHRFKRFQNADIVLYGIGRYTATLLEGLNEFHIVGLMDKDPDNIGRIMFGLPILDKKTVEAVADIVIINTSETYWDVIYKRIRDMSIPIYYINGERAKDKEEGKIENPFKGLSYSELLLEIEKAEVISFDFFDTLFMRSVCNPQDIFRLLESQMSISIIQTRDMAKKCIRENYTLDELYEQMKMEGNITSDQAEEIKCKEIELEKILLVPREQIISCLKNSLKSGKEIYIISDMYLPKTYYCDVFKQYEILISEESILLSNELDANKADGTIWKYYSENILKGRSALHIGDNKKADIEKPKEYNVKTYQVPSVWDLFLNSSLKEAASYICNDYNTMIMGCVLNRLFRDPYVLYNTDGRIYIKNNFDMGYCVFGPIILTFGLWLLNRSKIDDIKRLIFMSRDGYFLKEDFEYLCELMKEQRECYYIGISRQLAMVASIETMQDLMEYISMPYTGSIEELFEDRFCIKGVEEVPNKQLIDYIIVYSSEIEKSVENIRENYLNYLEKYSFDIDCAVVDIGYYGNNQKYLNKLLKKKISGYYFNANLSEKNKNAKDQKMVACFQKDGDVTGERSQILRRQIYLESFLTAPYGMVKAVDKKGNFVCAPQKKNQEHFQDKLEINQGVKQYIYDYWKLFGKFKICQDYNFIDWYYGYCFSGGFIFSENVKRSFYNDNALMNRIESMLFY